MGSFSTWHWLSVLLLLCLPLVLFWLMLRALRKRRGGGAATEPGTAERLQQLEALRASGYIGESEYRQKRSEILQQL